MPTGIEPTSSGRIARRYARVVVALRWWVISFWAVVTLLTAFVLPDLGQHSEGNALKGLLNAQTPSVSTELRSVDAFGFPLIGRTVLVQRNPGGITVYDQARTVTNATAVNRGKYKVGPLLGALPITNASSLFPDARERDTTSLTYLFFDPSVPAYRQSRSAHRYAERYFGPRDDVVGVTGSIPAQASQGRIVKDHLPLVELTTLGAIMLIVGLAFRSVLAPVIALAATGVAYVMTLHLAGVLTSIFGVSTPNELEPVVVALLLGIVTDYVVFFFSALRNELARGATGQEAALAATARFGPIVTVAGLAVAAGTGVLFAARSSFFRALGPALSFTVIVGLIVAVTLVPAIMAVLGRMVFWPTRNVAAQADDAVSASGRPKVWVRFSPTARFAHDRKRAAMVAAACGGVLVLAALPLLRLELGVSFVGALPRDTEVRRASSAAQAGFADGILSPTVVLLEGPGITEHRKPLRRLGTLLSQQPGVAGVVGPGDQPLNRETGIVLARDGSAARYLVVLKYPPLEANAIRDVDLLTDRLPTLVADSGVQAQQVGVAGDSAAASYIVHQTQNDLIRIAIAALLANFLVLIIFLRAAPAAAYLLVASLLSVAATLGLTTLVFDLIAPGQGLTFYVPFAAAVLLLAFGSDYNIFGAGHVWDEARGRSLPDALIAAMPGTTRALVTAGLALAASFGMLAVVPLLPFRQLAFAMSTGVLLDIFVVRLLLMPALLTLVGPISAWPSKRLTTQPTPNE